MELSYPINGALAKNLASRLISGPHSSRRMLGLASIIGLVYIYAPLLVLVAFSFNGSKLLALPLRGVTLRWYGSLLTDSRLLEALEHTVEIALGAIVIAMVMGIPGAFAVDRYRFRGKMAYRALIYIPIVLPAILNGISEMVWFRYLHIRLGVLAVTLAHGTIFSALVFAMVYARLLRLDRSLEEASQDLGATKFQTFHRVLFPNIRTTLVMSAMLIFAYSADDLGATLFLIGNSNSLQMEIWGRIRLGYTPELNALAAVFIVFTGVVLLLFFRYFRRELG